MVDVSELENRRPATSQSREHRKIQRSDNHLAKTKMEGVGGSPPPVSKGLEHLGTPPDKTDDSHEVTKTSSVNPFHDRVQQCIIPRSYLHI